MSTISQPTFIELENLPNPSLKQKLITSVVYGVIFAILQVALSLASKTVEYYLLSGLFFGIFMGFANPYLSRLFRSKKSNGDERAEGISFNETEKILVKGAVNLFKNNLGAGGEMYLTTERLIFTSPKLRFNNDVLELPLSSIENVESKKSSWLVNEVFTVRIPNKEYQFVSFNKDVWISQIRKQLGN
ncbi:GRAM domain-containing protein [Roseivirga spongicola]|uniref:GRAM domain-containing protein n=1 Tax=Roseivirga spongicola TaxID=333140 RepID=UPI002AC8AF46|nr:GRAM domain-containing protein [Roseivirga spongicola]WPZ09320.1 GRAM domain-containing protein [Roseivirga spongicola]